MSEYANINDSGRIIEVKTLENAFEYIKENNLINETFEVLKLKKNGKNTIAYSFRNCLIIIPDYSEENFLFEKGSGLEEVLDGFNWKVDVIDEDKQFYKIRPSNYYEREEIIDNARNPYNGIVNQKLITPQ